ncbi:hypothetical protein GCM10011581_23820 [Saccharopolyspora subtropica]|uniref:Uncharacterized protein n=1 Tax=Saccharopolyspora thermophila TaxID=89367 RepID=A0A917JUR5_9PSEU|nr:hypothetical protein [Saccharopolyspora subtropica]GGI85960.1 hypothetical protein GCM10011581_23820 [Saccharopolyspora subtropica]
MRMRALIPAALGALGMLLSLPGSAGAAIGSFTYSLNQDGVFTRQVLHNPVDDVCQHLVAPWEPAAYQVNNWTDATAVVFRDADCSWDSYYVLEPGEKAPAGVLVRSVLFWR